MASRLAECKNDAGDADMTTVFVSSDTEAVAVAVRSIYINKKRAPAARSGMGN